jgi:4-hydroxy-3-polyprenylbenzoate decarboxylase
MKLIVGITGASGAIYGIKLLEVLNKQPQIETHLVLSDPAKQTIELETNWTVAKVEALASFVHDSNNIGASISSGSFRTDGMIVVPCSIKTMSSIAISYNNNLIVRAADVTLKEKKRLVLAVRETPLHLGHLRKMVELAEIGAVILPPMPAFYHHPKTIDDIIEQTVGKILDQFDITHNLFKRWQGVDDTIGSETEAGRF